MRMTQAPHRYDEERIDMTRCMDIVFYHVIFFICHQLLYQEFGDYVDSPSAASGQ